MVKRCVFAVPGDLATPTGGYAYDRRMIGELRKLGWQIDVLDLGNGFPAPDEKTRAAAEKALANIPAETCVIVDGLALGVLPQAAAQVAARNPLVALVHHPLALETGLSAEQSSRLYESERAALAAARIVIAVSPATAETLTADYRVPKSRVTVARPGNDPMPMAQGSTDGFVRLLSVGAVVPRKGFDVLIEALATLKSLPWRLTIAGDRTRSRDTAVALDQLIAKHALADRVTVTGAISAESLSALYARSDAFVLASHFEGYGMAYAEALAHGLPVVGTNAGAIADTVPSNAAILVAPGDVHAFATALRRMIGDTHERQRLAAGARAAARQLPAWQRSAKIFSDALAAIA